MTQERRDNNVHWPQWLHEAWNREAFQKGAAGPYCMDHNLTGRMAVNMGDIRGGHPVEWGQWIVRTPGGALSIENDFKPGQ